MMMIKVSTLLISTQLFFNLHFLFQFGFPQPI
jgi:hypothetical protein